MTNPPYGERIEGAPGLDLELAQAFRALRGYRVCVLARDRGFPRGMQRRHPRAPTVERSARVSPVLLAVVSRVPNRW